MYVVSLSNVIVPRTRRRFAPLLLVVGAAAVGGTVLREWPRELDIEFRLVSGARDATEARVEYLLDGESIASATLRPLPTDARRWTHRVQLAPGRYDVAVSVCDSRGAWTRYDHALTSPADGVVRFDLEEAR